MNIRRIFLISAANTGIILVLLLLTEAALRVLGIPYKESFTPSENAVARFDKDLGWSYIPNFSGTLKAGKKSYAAYFDDMGIRVPRPGYTLSPERPSILFVGCSFTMGHGLSYEESFVGQFEQSVRGAYQTVNLGVQAYGTDQALLALKKFMPRFNTKAVVYMFIPEHIYRNGNYDRRYLYPDAKMLGTKPLFALGRDGRPYLAKHPVLYRDYHQSYLYDLLMMKLETLRGTGPPYPEDLTKSLIREMAAYCEAHHVIFVMVNWRWTDRDYDNFANLPVEIIDTLDTAPDGWSTMKISGDDHPNAAADRHVALLLRRRLSKHMNW